MRSLVVSEFDKIAALLEDGRALDFLISKHEYGVGDLYTVKVENIMPAIDAVFVKLEDGRMGFLHANDVPGSGNLYDRVYPGQKLMVQIVKEPTGKKGPRVNLSISIPGRYFVLSNDNSGIAISRKIAEGAERNRLKSIANLMKPEDIGLVIRTEASGHSQEELEEDFVNLWERWKNAVDKHERNSDPGLIYKEQDFLYSTLRDFFNSGVDEIIVDSMQGKYRAEEFLKGWTGREVAVRHIDQERILSDSGVEAELRNCLYNRVDLPSGGYIIIQTTEALTSIDINSGRFTSSTTLRETVRRTNMEAAVEIARQMRLRNIGGMIIVDFIDMSNRMDRIAVMETMETALKTDKAKPQLGQLSDLCLAEITRKRSGQALSEIFGKPCSHCDGLGVNFYLRGTERKHVHQQQAGGQRYSNQRDNRNRRDRDRRDRDDRRDNRNRDDRRDDRGGDDRREERGERRDDRRDDRRDERRDDRGERGERREERGDRSDRRDDRGDRNDRGRDRGRDRRDRGRDRHHNRGDREQQNRPPVDPQAALTTEFAAPAPSPEPAAPIEANHDEASSEQGGGDDRNKQVRRLRNSKTLQKLRDRQKRGGAPAKAEASSTASPVEPAAE